MAKEEDRHVGKREALYFPWAEHEAMLKAMETIHEGNKSVFIRTAVRNFCRWIQENHKD